MPPAGKGGMEDNVVKKARWMSPTGRNVFFQILATEPGTVGKPGRRLCYFASGFAMVFWRAWERNWDFCAAVLQDTAYCSIINII